MPATSTKSPTVKLPPQSVEAEQSLLGALLIDKDAIIKVSELLNPENFYRTEQHGQIYNAILQLYDRREPIDHITVTEQLRQNGALDQVGGSAYLAELVNLVPTAAHIEAYAKIIKDQSVRRQLIARSTKFIENAYDESYSVDQIIEDAEQNIFAISQEHIHRDFVHIGDIVAASFDRLDDLRRNANRLRGVPTGFRDLDNKLAGLQDSNLIILAARPGVGKTSFALNVALHAAVKSGIPVAVFSLEMSQEELVDRLLVTQADIDAWKLKTGNFHDDDKDYDRLTTAMGELAEIPLYIDDTPGASLADIRTKARRLQIENGLRLIIVDYLQLITGRNIESRVQQVSEISQGLKNLARELKVPVIALSQLSRAVESRTVKKPQLADLRESGAIEQDADVVMFLYRDDQEGVDDKFFRVKLDIQKHRNGPTGDIDLMFRGDRIKFIGMEKTRTRPAPAKAESATNG